MDQDFFIPGRELLPPGVILGRLKDVAVYEIGDHFDGALDVELLQRHLSQIFRDGRDSIAFLDRKARDGQIRPVDSDKGDIRSVERRYKWDAARPEHRARQVGAHRMGNGVMNVQKVERFACRHVVHLRRKRQGIGGMVEQGIIHHLHFMEMNAFRSLRHADGNGVADEVDFVPTRRQLETQLGGYHTTPTVCRITRDTNFHGVWESCLVPEGVYCPSNSLGLFPGATLSSNLERPRLKHFGTLSWNGTRSASRVSSLRRELLPARLSLLLFGGRRS